MSLIPDSLVPRVDPITPDEKIEYQEIFGGIKSSLPFSITMGIRQISGSLLSSISHHYYKSCYPSMIGITIKLSLIVNY